MATICHLIWQQNISHLSVLKNVTFRIHFHLPNLLLTEWGCSGNKGKIKHCTLEVHMTLKTLFSYNCIISNQSATYDLCCNHSTLMLSMSSLVMASNHLIPCHPLFLLPSIFLSIRVFSKELALCIRWPKYGVIAKSYFHLFHPRFCNFWREIN